MNSDSHSKQKSPGVEDGPIEQGTVEVVTHKVSAHHRAFAAFWSGDGFGDDHVGLVPQIQQMDVKDYGGVWRNYVA